MSGAGRIPWAVRRFCLQYGFAPAAFLARLAALRESQHWPADRLADHQQALLRDALECAAAAAPHYREMLARLKLTAAEVAGRGRLGELPVLGREELSRLIVDASAAGLRDDVRVSSSSGTSGRPVRTLHGRESRLSNQTCRTRALGWHGVEAWERQGLLVCQRMTARDRMISFLADRAAGRRRNGAFDLGHSAARLTARRFARFRPAYIIGMPSFFSRLAWFAPKSGVDPRDFGARVLMCNTELIVPPIERRIAAAFGAAVCNEYGCTEVGSLAHRCPRGTLHLNPEHAIVELLDADGRAVPPGVPGQVVLTTLQNRVLPLIRYAVGDVAVRAATPCPCGLQPGLPGLERVEGRARSAWRNPAGAPVAAYLGVTAALDQLNWDEVIEAQLVQRADGAVELRSLPATPPGAAVLGAMAEALTASLGFAVRLESAGREVARAPSGKQLPFFRESDD